MKVTPKGNSNIQDVDFNNLKFGTVFSDHMLICEYKDGEWGEVKIMPYQPLPMQPGTQVFHYGQSVFEGMKAYKNKEGKTLLFRPLDNLKRFNTSSWLMICSGSTAFILPLLIWLFNLAICSIASWFPLFTMKS